MSILTVRSTRTVRPACLHVEQLEDRLGPSALDLFTSGVCGLLNSFEKADPQPSNVTVIQGFLHNEKNGTDGKQGCDGNSKSDPHGPSGDPDWFNQLWSDFGRHDHKHDHDHGHHGQGGGTGTTPPPAPATLAGVVYLDVNDTGIYSSGDTGIGSVTITLTGTTSTNQAVSETAITASDGTYSFTGLQAGTYTLTETPPANYQPGTDTAGTVNGAIQGAVPQQYVISNVQLKAGQAGVSYNFGEFNQSTTPPVIG